MIAEWTSLQHVWLLQMGGALMNIMLDKDVAALIRKPSSDNAVTLFIKSGSGGWCSVQVPTVQLGKPQKEDHYDIYNVDDINVFISKTAKVRNNEIHIFMRKFLWVKELAVDGLQISI